MIQTWARFCKSKMSWILVLSLMGCSTPKFIKDSNVRLQGSIAPLVDAEYSTVVQDGDLDVNYVYSYGFEVGYFGLLPNLNLGLEYGRGMAKANAFDEDFNLVTRFLTADYVIGGLSLGMPFVGVGIGSIGQSFGGEAVDDFSEAWMIRGGYCWRIKKSLTIAAIVDYQKASSNNIRRFFFFAPEGEVTYSAVAVGVSLILNMFSKEERTTPDQTPK